MTDPRQAVYSELCRRMVNNGYLHHARSRVKRGAQKPEGKEDLLLPKGFIVYCNNIENSPLEEFIEDDMHWVAREPDFSRQLDGMLETYDGANVIDSERISYPVVFSSLKEAREIYNSEHGTSYRHFSHLLPFFLPSNFTYHDGSQIKAGSKTKTAIAIALIGKDHASPVEAFLSKTTVYGSLGTGKVTRMVVKGGIYYYEEFYLLRDDELKGEVRERVTKDSYIDKPQRAVAVRRVLETRLSEPTIKLKKKEIVPPSEILG